MWADNQADRRVLIRPPWRILDVIVKEWTECSVRYELESEKVLLWELLP